LRALKFAPLHARSFALRAQDYFVVEADTEHSQMREERKPAMRRVRQLRVSANIEKGGSKAALSN
jgi:hypothetical protein